MGRVPEKQIYFAGAADFTRKVHAAFRRAGLTPSAAAVATAHVALSTGWGRSVHNYSLAGIKAGPKAACYGQPSAAVYGGDWFCSCSWEFTASGGKVAGCSNCSPKYGNPRCKYPFRAYRSIDEGARAVLGILKAGRRYSRALKLLKAGSTDYFAEVGRAGWYTSNVDKTAAAMKRNHAKVLNYLNMSAPSSGAGFLAALALGVGIYIAWRKWS